MMNWADAIMVVTTVMALALATYSIFYLHHATSRAWWRGYEKGRRVGEGAVALRGDINRLKAKIGTEEEQEQRDERRLQ